MINKSGGFGNRRGIFNELGELEFLEGYVSDISERKRIELELQNAHNELTAIFDSGPVSIVKTDAQGVITHWNKGAERLLQYSADEMIGKMNPGIFHDPVEFAERARKHEIDLDPSNLFEAFKQLALLGEFDSKEWKHIRKDGVPIPVQVVVTPTIDDQGYVSGFVGIAIDITESKSAQEKSKTLLKITTEQNKRLKNFAHIVSHNLRSHSGNFLMMLDLIDDMHPQLKDDEIIQNIRLAANDLQKTINHLNEVVLLSASGEIGMVRVGLQSHIASAIQNVAFLAKDTGVEIINNVPNAIGIKGIPAYIDSILINFISNAIKYSDPEKRSFVRLHTELKDNHVLLKIEDNGLGINLKANKDRIFGMFKTFHDNTDSRGLGLFMARNQIEALGGDVSVESEVGVGTTFTIHLQSA